MTGAERSAAEGAAPVTAAGDRDGFAALFNRYRRELQDALRQRRHRRVLPFEVMDPVRPDRPLPAAAGELWLEPFPDRPLGDLGGEAGPDPGETVVHRETIELVFLAAIQHLPARQRVVFVISPIQGTGVGYSGTYREHSAGNFLVVNGEDIPHPAASFYLHGTGTGSDGSQIRFTIRGHFALDKRTGEVRRNTIISTCPVS